MRKSRNTPPHVMQKAEQLPECTKGRNGQPTHFLLRGGEGLNATTHAPFCSPNHMHFC